MQDRSASRILLRKRPKQTRSAQTFQDIVEAASQVFAQRGPANFTTVQVAERAGVSVGSLYQYFPNKQAILFHVQVEAWMRRGRRLEAILGDRRVPLLDRLPIMVRTLLRDEYEARTIRAVLTEAAPAYRRTSESREVRVYAMRTVQAYVHETAPGASTRDCALAAELICTTLAALRKACCAARYDLAEIDARADLVSAMFVGYLADLDRRSALDFAAAI